MMSPFSLFVHSKPLRDVARRRALSVPAPLFLAGLCCVWAITMTAHPTIAQTASSIQVSPFSGDDREVLDHAHLLFEEQQWDQSLAILEEFIENRVDSPLLHEAYWWQAQVLQNQRELEQAGLVLEQLIEEFPLSPYVNDARLLLADLSIQLGRFDRATQLLNMAQSQATDTATRQRALDLLREVHEKTGNLLAAIQAALDEMNMVEEERRGELHTYVQTIVLQNMDEPALRALRDAFPAMFPGDLALIRLIELHTAKGDEVLAERDIRTFLNQFPSHPYAQTALALLQSFMAKIQIHRHVVAAVLPFSGPLQPFGTDSLNGIRLALEESEQTLGTQAVGLVVKDSTTTPHTFRQQFSQLLDEFHPVAVIGPLLGREIREIADLANEAEVPVITPSATLSNIRQFGRFWFSTALTPSIQVEKLVRHAMETLGYQRFGILFPQTASGRDFQRAFQLEVLNRGGEIIAAESYPPGSTELSPQIERLKQADLNLYGQITPIPTQLDETRDLYIPGFDAIFLPGRPVDVAFISAQLAFFDITVPLLGNNGWNHPDLLKWGMDALDGGIFETGLFLESPDPEVQDFIRRYRRRFHANPSIFSVQAYDAARVVLDTLRLGASTGLEVRDQLFIRHDLPALSGRTRFGPGGVLDRKVFLIQLAKRKLHQIN